MTNQLKNIIIGVFVLAALLIVIFILLFLHPHVGDEKQVLYVMFSDIDKVNVGTRVTFAGKPVGEVTAINEVEKGREGPVDSYNHYYVYELTLRIDSKVPVYDTDEITLRTSGLLGERSVAIIPVAPKRGATPHLLQKNEVIFATPTGSVEETMSQFKVVAENVDIALKAATTVIQDIRDERIVQKVSDTVSNLRSITDALNKPEELSGIIDNIHRLSSRVVNSWDVVDESLNNIEKSSENAVDFTKSLKEIISRIRQGKGTAGKILVSDDLYLRLVAILNKGETVMDDINHYGLLFQLDKGWQRKRARQMNLLQKLSSPQQFRNYFNDQVDQISTSLSRVSMLLDKTGGESPEHPLYENSDFKKVFAELLRRVQAVEDSIKMYNNQLVEPDVKKMELADACITNQNCK